MKLINAESENRIQISIENDRDLGGAPNFANAIEHAYSPSPSKFELNAVAIDNEVIITIRDTGRWRSPRGEDRGRGLTIIETAMDKVDVNATEGGTEIVMRRRIGSQ